MNHVTSIFVPNHITHIAGCAETTNIRIFLHESCCVDLRSQSRYTYDGMCRNHKIYSIWDTRTPPSETYWIQTLKYVSKSYPDIVILPYGYGKWQIAFEDSTREKKRWIFRVKEVRSVTFQTRNNVGKIRVSLGRIPVDHVSSAACCVDLCQSANYLLN